MSLEADLAARLRHLTRTARMWGSPEELECTALHLTHVWLAARSPGWSLAQTLEFWAGCGAPFAADAAEHAAMRDKLWGREEALALGQVLQGYAVIWAGLARHPEREPHLAAWIEALLDSPQLAGAPDRLNMVLFATMGFAAADPHAFVEALNAQRLRIGGHELRALPIVGAPGPSEAGLAYGRKFSSWDAVIHGIEVVLGRLEAPVV